MPCCWPLCCMRHFVEAGAVPLYTGAAAGLGQPAPGQPRAPVRHAGVPAARRPLLPGLVRARSASLPAGFLNQALTGLAIQACMPSAQWLLSCSPMRGARPGCPHMCANSCEWEALPIIDTTCCAVCPTPEPSRVLRWDAYGWMRPSAYTLFGLSPPWEAEGAAFRTTESGQMLMNRRALLSLPAACTVLRALPARPLPPLSMLLGRRTEMPDKQRVTCLWLNPCTWWARCERATKQACPSRRIGCHNARPPAGVRAG